MMYRSSFLKVVSVTFFAGIWALGAPAYAAEVLKLEHSVYLGGLYMGSIKTEIEQDGTSYVVRAKALTNQKLKWVLSWRAEAVSQGRIKDMQVLPVKHMNTSRWKKKKERGADIKYTPAGEVSYSVIGKKERSLDRFTPLDPETLNNSIDPMSMILAAMVRFEKNKVCSGTYPVFDGRRRYDVTLSDGGTKMLEKSTYSAFKGQAIGCKFKVTEKGGFERERNYEITDPSDLVVWVASLVPGGPTVPVRMKISTGFGAIMLHLEKYSQGQTRFASKSAQ